MALAIFLVFCFLSLLGLLGLGFLYFQRTANLSGKTVGEFWQMAQTVKQAVQDENRSSLTILALGSDQSIKRDTTAVLTDTMFVVKLDFQSGNIFILPIPRDLWHQELQTKINALLSYGTKYYPDQPEKFVSEHLSQMLGITIDKTIVLSIDDLGELIGSLGGVELNVESGFVDNQYPRENINDNQTELSPYKTVEFKSGWQKFNQDQALIYIRSRKTQDIKLGNDLSRNTRQQQVLMAISEKITSWEFLKSPENVAGLLNFYELKFEKYWPLTDALSAATLLLTKHQKPTFINQHIPVWQDNQPGYIYHPNPNLYHNLWVYVEKEPGILRTAVPKLLELK